MDEAVVTALIAAGAAIGGGMVTGLFTLLAAKKQAQAAVDAAARQAAAAWAAGERQAAAAWEAGRQQAAAAWDAGQLQATAQLDVARRTLNEQMLAGQRDVRRAAYVTCLGRADTAHKAYLAWQNALGSANESPCRQAYDSAVGAVGEALDVIRLEGPGPVATAAEALKDSLGPTAPGTRYSTAQEAFLTAARAALTPT
ncbi:hypothetical protein [Streptomyces sp. NPDC055287]